MKVEITKRIKLELKLSENSSGVITAPTPNIKNIFKTHEPTKLPTAKSVSFFKTAIIEVIISGIAVPIATIVSPITLSDIPNCSAMLVA